MGTTRVVRIVILSLIPGILNFNSRLVAEPVTEQNVVKAAHQWETRTFEFTGPECSETSNDPNPFLDYRLTLICQHATTGQKLTIPGHFAADGQASESSAESGNRWRVHYRLPSPGRWTCQLEFVAGDQVAINPHADVSPVTPWNGQAWDIEIMPWPEQALLHRRRGPLVHRDRRYLQFAGTGETFLKFGTDSPETLLAYTEFDGTVSRSQKGPLLEFQPHRQDWQPGNPSWKKGRGQGLIGALNYLSQAGCNTISFLTYNAGGDGDNVWPHLSWHDKQHFDCSKLDQWRIVLEYANQQGLLLHVKLQETENDDLFHGHQREQKPTPAALDAGETGIDRKLYLRELVSRFAHLPLLEWNLGEENTQTLNQQLEMASYLAKIDPYDHPIVLHTYPNEQDQVYEPYLQQTSPLTGLSLQNQWSATHARTVYWVKRSREQKVPWVICNDEQGPASHGVPSDPGFAGQSGIVTLKNRTYDLHDIRQQTLWGNLMAGGAGVQYYFGYQLPENDLRCQNFRSRDQTWAYGRHALSFFQQLPIDLNLMQPADQLLQGSIKIRYCLACAGRCYIVYKGLGHPDLKLDLTGDKQNFSVHWYNPRSGGTLQLGGQPELQGGGIVSLGSPPAEIEQDWVILLQAGN